MGQTVIAKAFVGANLAKLQFVMDFLMIGIMMARSAWWRYTHNFDDELMLLE